MGLVRGIIMTDFKKIIQEGRKKGKEEQEKRYLEKLEKEKKEKEENEERYKKELKKAEIWVNTELPNLIKNILKNNPNANKIEIEDYKWGREPYVGKYIIEAAKKAGLKTQTELNYNEASHDPDYCYDAYVSYKYWIFLED